MKIGFPVMIIFAASAGRPALPDTPRLSSPWKFSLGCLGVAKKVDIYFSEHGLYTYHASEKVLQVARGSVNADGIDGFGRKAISGTDAHGTPINDFRVYWNFANRKTGEKFPFGSWHLRLSHYACR